MPMPAGIPIIDTMLSVPSGEQKRSYDFMRPLLRDAESLRSFDFPVEYMFKDFPKVEKQEDYITYTLQLMDRFGIERAMTGVTLDDPEANNNLAVRRHPDRFIATAGCDPNRGMEGVRDLVRIHEAYGIKSVSAFPAGNFPQIPISDGRWYPIYAKCIELDVALFCCMGVPGPRIPMAPQHVEQVDEICWFFPELRFVFRHGTEPWQALAVKLMLKWPNLFYSTSAFAPKHYPKEIIAYANTRGADKILYAGYFPAGLTLERIFGDLPNVPFRDHVWPKFLRENAERVLKL
ncbi:MAG: amidohydrolase family protein [Myxococcota bacterium]